MELRFFKDPETGLAHCYRGHGVSEPEVVEILRRPGERFRRRDGTLVADGQTNAVRYLRVIYREFPEEDYRFIITAYDLTGRAKQSYRRRRKNR
jgi:hypothetical protein